VLYSAYGKRYIFTGVGEARIITISRRLAGALLGALAVLVVGILACSLSASQLLARRTAPPVTPTRTPRPTWTPAAQGLLVASPTVDATRFPSLIPDSSPATPQILVAGAAQGVVVPQGGSGVGVQTVVVILVTATPAPPATLLPAGPTFTPGPTNTPGPPTATPTATYTPSPPVVVHVKIDQANVRQGPGETYPLVTRLDKDTAVTVVGRNHAGDWWKICCVNNSDVWIADSVVKVDGPIWTVAEASDIPPAPPAPPTPAPTPTPSLTPTYAWGFHLQQDAQAYPLGQDFFQVSAIIYNGATPLWGYKLKIRKDSTGEEWLSDGSESYWKTDTIQWNKSPTPNVNLNRNVKWDSNSVSVPMGDGVWEVTVTDGAGNPLSAPVRINTSVAKSMWYYLVFTQ
jgi:uncharacterized protein YgiM (DUF1202 family)